MKRRSPDPFRKFVSTDRIHAVDPFQSFSVHLINDCCCADIGR